MIEASSKTDIAMDRKEKPRARCCNLISLAILMAAIFVVLVTAFMFTVNRSVVMQTARIQTLETVVSDLAARLRKLEASFTAQRSDEETASKTDRNVQTNTKNSRNKVGCRIVRNFSKQYHPSPNELLLWFKFMHMF